MTEGYSGTPLVQKLGIKPDMKCAVLGPPEHYRDLLIGLPDDVSFVGGSASGLDFVHLFVRREDGLMDRLRKLRERIAQDGMIWVSWPKKAAGVRTDLTEDLVRQSGLSAGLVDVKVCAVDEIWSGLKFVIRKAERR